jgi:methionyl-tRNA synthetase
MGKTIVTSALPYINAMPHLGNVAGSILPSDVYSRYLRMKGEDVIFICGSDEHGTPTELSAIKRGMVPIEFARQQHKEVKRALEELECAFSVYGETDSEANREITYCFFEALNKNGYIMTVEDTQPYCTVDRRFISDRFIEGICPYCKKPNARGDQCDDCGKLLEPQQLIEPYCKICGNKEVEFRKTKNLALDLTKLQPAIKAFVEKNSSTWTKNAVNKTLSYIKLGLKPRDITRDLSLGFPVPMKGFEGKVFYVWFDAVLGYIGITKGWDESAVKDYWLDKRTRLVQFMGKDNIEFHTMIWPGILIGADLGYVMPHTIIAYEFLHSRAIKFSKSRGVGLNIKNALGIMRADYWRFTLIYLLPETADTEFSLSAMSEIVNKIMNDKIGNLIHRALSIAKSNRQLLGEVSVSADYEDAVKKSLESYSSNFERIRIREALRDVVGLADMANGIMSNEKPWELLGKDDARFSGIIGTVLKISQIVGMLLWPFTPEASAKALEYFNIRGEPRLGELGKAATVDMEKHISPIFTKMTDAEIKALEKFAGD